MRFISIVPLPGAGLTDLTVLTAPTIYRSGACGTESVSSPRGTSANERASVGWVRQR